MLNNTRHTGPANKSAASLATATPTTAHWATQAIQEIWLTLNGAPATVKTVAAASHLLEAHPDKALRQLAANLLHAMLCVGDKVPLRVSQPHADLPGLIEIGQILSPQNPGVQRYLQRTAVGLELVDHL
ncbi:MAG TPA: hypothetical protein VFV57_04335 [Limnobacter sp.]|nr:hypothetical protein [Limnobacter sp.]